MRIGEEGREGIVVADTIGFEVRDVGRELLFCQERDDVSVVGVRTEHALIMSPPAPAGEAAPCTVEGIGCA